MNFSIEVEGVERLERDAVVLQRNFHAPIRPVAGQVEEVVFSAVRAQYASRGTRGPHGREWTRKQSTIDRYTAMNRRGYSVLNEPMRRTDALFKSEVTRGGPHSVSVTEDDRMARGTDLFYGRIQQEKRGQLQYDLTEGDIRRILSIINRGIVKDVNHFFDFVDAGEFAF
jgi:hypothetical protein